jgi:hypothetical protein
VPSSVLFLLRVGDREHYLVTVEVLRPFGLREFQSVDAAVKPGKLVHLYDLLFIFVDVVQIDNPVVASRGHQI